MDDVAHFGLAEDFARQVLEYRHEQRIQREEKKLQRQEDNQLYQMMMSTQFGIIIWTHIPPLPK